MGGMRHGRHRTTCLIRVFNTQVGESKAAVQIPELYFTGVTPEGCSGLCSTGQHSPTFSSATQGCLTVQNITHELTRSVAAHLILSSLMSGILEDFWSHLRLTKWSSSGEAIPLEASPGFQSCCTSKIKPFSVCPPCPSALFQPGVMLGWSLTRRFPNSEHGTLFLEFSEMSSADEVTQSGLSNSDWISMRDAKHTQGPSSF